MLLITIKYPQKYMIMMRYIEEGHETLELEVNCMI